jgi:general secretion pathway protein E
MTELKDTDFLESFKRKYEIPLYEDLLDFDFIQRQITLVPYSFAKAHFVLPLQEEEDKILVAMANPLQLDTIEELRCLTSKNIKEILCTKNAIEEAIQICYHNRDGNASEVIASLETALEKVNDFDLEGYDLLEDKSDSPVVIILNSIFKEAIMQGASDIHFDPQEIGIGVRYRIDGVLQQRHSPPREYQSQLITRIKVMSCLDIAEQRLPQDGRIKLRMGNRHVDLRVSTVPCSYGERIVLRILDKSNISVGL